MRKISVLVLVLSVLVLPSCTAVGLAVGAGASVGVAAAQEGGISRAVSDAHIQLQINDLWFKYSIEAFRKLDLTINQGRVLVTGVVQNPEHRVEAIRLAWQPKGVEQVINEIQVTESQGITGFARDTWITTRLRTALTFDGDVLSINYSIDTVQGTVYLMGFAQNRGELNRVIETARTISGVSGVVSYVKIVSGVNESDRKTVWRDGNYADEPASRSSQVSYGGGATNQGIDNHEPIVISPEFQSAPDEGPYILRQPSSAVQENLEARAVQTQRIEGSSSVRQASPVRQGIESEEIIWNQ